MKHLGFASLSAVRQYLRYAQAHSIDCLELLRSANLPVNLVHEHGGRIQGTQFQQLLVHLLAISKDPMMGLNSSLFVQAESYNILGAMVLHCDTLGEAIEQIGPFERLVGDMGTTTIHKAPNSVELRWQCHYSEARVTSHMIDNVLASWTLFARNLTGNNARPLHVYLERRRPEPALQQKYQAFFGCPIHYEAKSNLIALDSALLGLKIKRTDVQAMPDIKGKARAELSALRFKDERVTDQVTRTIRAHLQMGSVRKALVAQEFNICERTLQRRLSAEGTKYQTLLNEVRLERARELLTKPEYSCMDIAYNIGLSDERSFYRCFKDWTGCSPDEYRKRT